MATVVDPAGDGDAGVPSGKALLAYTSTVVAHDADRIAEARQALEDDVGADGVVEAAATVAIFNGLVRVADGTGIQLDPQLLTVSMESRAAPGIDEFAGAISSESAEAGAGDPRSIEELFS